MSDTDEWQRMMDMGRAAAKELLLDQSDKIGDARLFTAYVSGILDTIAAGAIAGCGEENLLRVRGVVVTAAKIGCVAGLAAYPEEVVLKHVGEFQR